MAEPPECRQARILILDGDNLLAAGLQSLLARDAGLEVRTLASSAQDALAGEIAGFHPDLVLVACHEPTSAPHPVLAALSECPAVRMVTMGCDSNTVYMYDRAEVNIKSLADLLALIPGGAEETPRR